MRDLRSLLAINTTAGRKREKGLQVFTTFDNPNHLMIQDACVRNDSEAHT